MGLQRVSGAPRDVPRSLREFQGRFIMRQGVSDALQGCFNLKLIYFSVFFL